MNEKSEDIWRNCLDKESKVFFNQIGSVLITIFSLKCHF